MNIATVSLNQVWNDKEANQDLCTKYITDASSEKADIIFFPEMTLTGFSMETQIIAESTDTSQTLSFFKAQAKDNNIAIGFGMVISNVNKASNNFVIINKYGEIIANYAKIHPFSYSGENDYYAGGNEPVTCKIEDSIFGLSICYDLRFPELFQILSKNAQIIVTIANWPETRINHWNILLKARAIENQCFTIGINRTGEDNNHLRYTKSTIVTRPTGESISPYFTQNELEIYNMPIIEVYNYRLNFPTKKDRKTELYKSLL